MPSSAREALARSFRCRNPARIVPFALGADSHNEAYVAVGVACLHLHDRAVWPTHDCHMRVAVRVQVEACRVLGYGILQLRPFRPIARQEPTSIGFLTRCYVVYEKLHRDVAVGRTHDAHTTITSRFVSACRNYIVDAILFEVVAIAAKRRIAIGYGILRRGVLPLEGVPAASVLVILEATGREHDDPRRTV